MSVEKPTEEDIKALDNVKNTEEISIKQQAENIKNEATEKTQQTMADAQAAIDKVNQELSEVPQKIEDELDNFNKILKTLMGKNVSPKVDINSPEFDINVALADFNAILNPLLGAVSPIESVVGKIPVLGDISGLISKMTSGGDTGGLTMDDIKKLVPNTPEIPPTLKAKVQETLVTIQEFCTQLPMLLFKVIFAMLGAIYDMFDQIVGIIGVPPPIFPFNLVKQMPTVVQKIQDFTTSAPSQVKTIVEGKLKEQFAAAQALATPQLPTPDEVLKAAKNSASYAASTASGGAAPKPKDPDPIESPVIPSPSTPPITTPNKPELTWDEVKAKWSKRFADDYNYSEEDIAKCIDDYKTAFDGEEKIYLKNTLIDRVQIRSDKKTAIDCDSIMEGYYNRQSVSKDIRPYIQVNTQSVIDNTRLYKSEIPFLEANKEKYKHTVIKTVIEPKSSFFGLF